MRVGVHDKGAPGDKVRKLLPGSLKSQKGTKGGEEALCFLFVGGLLITQLNKHKPFYSPPSPPFFSNHS